MKQLVLIVFGVLILAFSACSKPGNGGAATIAGTVTVRLIKESTLDTLTTFDAQDERVYLIYGENNTFDDDTRTTYNGNFNFYYLFPGDYTIYVYSDCTFLIDECPNESTAIVQNISIGKARETVDLGEIIINKYIK